MYMCIRKYEHTHIHRICTLHTGFVVSQPWPDVYGCFDDVCNSANVRDDDDNNNIIYAKVCLYRLSDSSR